jgi:hypothetical protein
MRQVLDFFELLSDQAGAERLAWSLTLASTSSPFTSEAEAVSVHDGTDIEALAADRLAIASDFMGSLQRGDRPTHRMSRRQLDAARRIFERHADGIGKTSLDFHLPRKQPLEITPEQAQVALQAAARLETPTLEYVPEHRQREEYGSIEGTLIDVGTHYGKPALRIVEKKTGREIVCRAESSAVDEIATKANISDVWRQERVSIRGRLYFNDAGQIFRVDARSVEKIAPRMVSIEEIKDKNFTNGLSIGDYLSRWREGDLERI